MAKRRYGTQPILPGSLFGQLRVKSFTGKKSRDVATCVCLCGATKKVRVGNLISKKGTRSCGCLVVETARKLLYKHGQSRTAEYRVWRHMRSRCERRADKDWPNYGGRGIKVCRRWYSFSMFVLDMGKRPSPKHTLERKNNNGNYSPANVEWVLAGKQASNRRNNIKITLGGKTQTMAQWARDLGVSRATVRRRLLSGWSPKQAVTTPYRMYSRWNKRPLAVRKLTKGKP